MKKVVVFFIVAMVVFGVCSAQRAEAQSANIAQRIIGTWVDQYGETWIFNANGNLTLGSSNYKFAVTDTKLVLDKSTDYGKSREREYSSVDIYDVSISSDGKTLILTFLYNGNSIGYWLTKK